MSWVPQVGDTVKVNNNPSGAYATVGGVVKITHVNVAAKFLSQGKPCVGFIVFECHLSCLDPAGRRWDNGNWLPLNCVEAVGCSCDSLALFNLGCQCGYIAKERLAKSAS